MPESILPILNIRASDHHPAGNFLNKRRYREVPKAPEGSKQAPANMSHKLVSSFSDCLLNGARRRGRDDVVEERTIDINAIVHCRFLDIKL